MDRLEKAIEMVRDFNTEEHECDYAKSYDCGECRSKEICIDLVCNSDELGIDLNLLDSIIEKESSIQLKNIDLRNVNFLQQGDKVIEERKEFTDAVADYKFGSDDEKLKNHAIEEFWDMVQAGVGLLQKVNIDADEVMNGYDKHLDKMDSRGNKPREKVQK